MSYRPSHRRRPGRRPPARPPGTRWISAPDGFTGPGSRQLYRRILPGLTGPAKKRYFNDLSGWIIGAAGACGLILGLAGLGPLGAILGLGLGITAGGSLVKSHRFYRE